MTDSPLHHIDTWLPFATALRETAPEGTRETSFRGSISRGSWSGSILDDGDGELRYANMSYASDDIVHDAIAPLMSLIEDRTVAVELTSTADGAVSVQVTEPSRQIELSIAGQGIDSVLLVPGAHPEPYRRAPIDHNRPLSPKVDPDAVVAIVKAVLPDASVTPSSVLDMVERRFDRPLPPDVRALYSSMASGDLVLGSDEDEYDDLFYGLAVAGIDDLDEHKWLTAAARYGMWSHGATETVAADPEGRVQGLAFSPAWLLIGGDWGGSYYVADLAPGPNGTYGQILFVDRDTLAGARWLAPSLTELLTERPTDLGPIGDTSGLAVWKPEDVTPATEVLRLRGRGEDADLSSLSGHPRLRTLVCPRGSFTGIDVVDSLPALEYLETDFTTWRYLLDSGRLPAGLLAAGFSDDDELSRQVPVANELLARCGGEPIVVTELSRPR